jgi:hypothetical protein
MDSDHIYNEAIKKHVHNIRNMNILTNEMLIEISKLSRDDMMNIIYTYNNTLKVYKKYIEDILEN